MINKKKCNFFLILLSFLIFPFSISLYPAMAADQGENAIEHQKMGIILLEQGRIDESLDEFKLALALNPSSTLAAALYDNVGIAYQRQGFYGPACQSFVEAIRMRPQFEVYYLHLVETYDKSQTLTRARQMFQKILTLNPMDAEGWYLMGLMNEKAGQPTDAREDFIKFLQLQPYSQLAQAAEKHL